MRKMDYVQENRMDYRYDETVWCFALLIMHGNKGST